MRSQKKQRKTFYQRILLWPSLFLLILAIPFLSGLYPVASFIEEQIDIHIKPDYIIVKGQYVYKNSLPFPIKQGFSIPFYQDEYHPGPVMLSAEVCTPEKGPIPVYYVLGKHRFELAFRAREEIRVKIQYRQQASTKDAYYLLTTTKPWRYPLIKGTYRLFQNGVRVISSNYLLKQHNADMFLFEKQMFMPLENWHFSWETA